MVVRRQRAHARTRNAVACTALLAAAACSAPPGAEEGFDDGPSEYIGPVPSASGGQNPAPAAPGVGTNTGTSPVAGGGEQTQTGGTPIAPNTPPASTNGGNTSNAG